jgi:hypothetical protein
MATYEALLARDLDWALCEGSMHFDAQSAVHRTLRRLTKRLDEIPVDYAVVGAFGPVLA